MPGEIRMQWWRDTLSGTAHGSVEANPLAASLLQVMEAHTIPAAPLLAVLDARTFDLYDDAMPSTGDFEGYAGEVWSGPMALAASILSGHNLSDFADLAGHGGVALTVARTLSDLPLWSGRGQGFLPADLMQTHGLARETLRERKPASELSATLRAFAAYGLDHLDQARTNAQNANTTANPIWLPLALARRTLEDADGWASAPFARSLAAPKWRRLYRLWRASKRALVF